MNLGAQVIKNLIAERFSTSNGFAFFPEFRTLTGYANARYIDAVAVGIWSRNNGIWAFEVKVDRGDFASDVLQFQHKHEQALALSHRFFYVCPWGLIDKGEVPDIAGLMWINKAGNLVTKKHAQLRVKNEIPMIHFLAFAKEFGRTIDHSKIPVRYLGGEMSQDDFLEIVEEKKKSMFSHEVKTEAWKLVEERKSENGDLRKQLKEIKALLRCWKDKDVLPEIKTYISKAMAFDGISKSVNDLQMYATRAQAIIKGTE